MAEIAISICTEDHRRSLAMSIQASMGPRKAGGIHTLPFVESEIGEGPLLPERDSMSYFINISVMNGRVGIRV